VGKRYRDRGLFHKLGITFYLPMVSWEMSESGVVGC
jgi:hypothetical protein